MNWEKVGTKQKANGERIVYYQWEDMRIESRRRAIRHANGQGYWFRTYYALIWPDGHERIFDYLREAKLEGERVILEEL